MRESNVVSRETGEPTQKQLEEFFGPRYGKVADFAALLRDEGEKRGLIGPREVTRLWSRHLVNSGGVATLIGEGVRVVDVGSGAGFPGLVVAAMRPDLDVILLEPMQRRTDWLELAATRLNLTNVRIERGRAEDRSVTGDVVTARAVARLGKLLRWCVPLLAPGGEILAIKGRKAAEEVTEAASVIRKLRLSPPEILTVQTIPDESLDIRDGMESWDSGDCLGDVEIQDDASVEAVAEAEVEVGVSPTIVVRTKVIERN